MKTSNQMSLIFYHIGTSQIICNENQLIGFYIVGALLALFGVFIVTFEEYI